MINLGFAALAGATTFFAPCAFPLLPGYLAFYVGDDASGGLRRAAAVGLLASAGFFAVFAVLAGVVVAVGASALRNVSLLEPVVGAVLVVLGVAMIRGWTGPHVALPERRHGAPAYFLFGVVYAVAAAGCTAPVFVAVALLGISNGPVAAVATLGAYAGGMSLLMVGVTALAALGRDGVLRRLSANTGRVTRVAGALLVLAGVVQTLVYLFYFGGLRELGLA